MAHVFKKLNLITTTQHIVIETNKDLLPGRVLLNDDDFDDDNADNNNERVKPQTLTIGQKKFIKQARAMSKVNNSKL
jgi:hypothetical protein